MKQLPIELIQLEPILSSINERNVHSLAVTASESQAGTSTLVLALAKRYANQHKSTLLVDFNFGSPTISHYFQQQFEDKKTLQESLATNIKATEIESLSLLPAPFRSQFLLELRNAEMLNHCFQEWQKKFDFVIADCSQLNTFDQQIIPAEMICKATNACIMVVLTGRTIEANLHDWTEPYCRKRSASIG